MTVVDRFGRNYGDKDVFLCTVSPSTKLRAGMAMLCAERWMLESDATVTVISPGSIGCDDPIEFQRERRIHADRAAMSDIYVVADDDCLLGPDSIIGPAVDVMRRHPEFAVLAPVVSNHPLKPWTGAPEGYEIFEDDEVVEHGACGGVRFCRQGHLPEWPPRATKEARYDGEHCEAIRATGGRVGYMKDIAINHVGEGYSETLRGGRIGGRVPVAG